ncbi:hypothetical protein ABZX75_33160 [Streptomyces sp. NPDC003038]|uniref:hypothetical protein n=1 Tax=unclassified Streptomyces TaxID=2593676 RepID=UPI0033AE1577
MAARKAKAGSAFDRLNKMTASGSLAGLNAGPAATDSTTDTVTASSAPPEASSADLNEAVATPPTPVQGPVAEVIAPRAEEPAAPMEPKPTPPTGFEDRAAEASLPEEAWAETAEVAPPAPEPLRVSPPGAASTHVLQGSISGRQGVDTDSGGNAHVPARRNATPSFTQGSGLGHGLAANLPTPLADKVRDLPVAYRELASSYRTAKDTRTGKTLKRRNIRLHTSLATTLRRQLVHDKRLLSIRDLAPSYYVDAALTFMRTLPTAQFIEAADQFRDRLVGADAGFEAPNHYSISKENDDWLEEMKDELMLAGTKGLHGHMINAIVEAFLTQLNQERPAED